MNREGIKEQTKVILINSIADKQSALRAHELIMRLIDQYKPPHIHACSVHGNVVIHGYQPDPDAMPPGEPPTVEDTISGKGR